MKKLLIVVLFAMNFVAQASLQEKVDKNQEERVVTSSPVSSLENIDLPVKDQSPVKNIRDVLAFASLSRNSVRSAQVPSPLLTEGQSPETVVRNLTPFVQERGINSTDVIETSKNKINFQGF